MFLVLVGTTPEDEEVDAVGQLVADDVETERTEADGEEWRVHFHVPIFVGSLEAFGTTQDFLAEMLINNQLAINPDNARGDMEGVDTTEPTSGLPVDSFAIPGCSPVHLDEKKIVYVCDVRRVKICYTGFVGLFGGSWL
mgnify:CR=1 FL=1